MKTPIRIVVVGDFKGTTDLNGPVRVFSKKTDALISVFKPKIELLSGEKYPIISMADFDADAIISRFGMSIIPDGLTRILHDKVFQQVEECWRGLDFLVSHLPENGIIQLAEIPCHAIFA